MPTYDYQCDANGRVVEVSHKMSEHIAISVQGFRAWRAELARREGEGAAFAVAVAVAGPGLGAAALEADREG